MIVSVFNAPLVKNFFAIFAAEVILGMWVLALTDRAKHVSTGHVQATLANTYVTVTEYMTFD